MTYIPQVGHTIIVHDAVNAYHGREAVVTSITPASSIFSVVVYNVQVGSVHLSLTRARLREINYQAA